MGLPPTPAEVIGIGAATLDRLWRLEALPSQEGVQRSLECHVQGGGPVATALCVLAHLGHSCQLVDALGDDGAGHLIREELMKHAVGMDFIDSQKGASSAEAVILVRASDGARHIVFHPASTLDPVINGAVAEAIRRSRLLHLNGRHENAAREAIRVARGSGVAIAFDGGAGRYRDSIRDLVESSHIRIVARDFAHAFSGAGSPDLGSFARPLLQPPCELLVITDGVRGSHVWTASGECFHQPACTASPCVDTTGCGDVFHGALLHGWLQHWPARECAAFASQAAAWNAEGLGGRFVIHDVKRLTMLQALAQSVQSGAAATGGAWRTSDTEASQSQ